MNTSFTNVALFIKRAEEYQTQDFIIRAFESNNIGKVKELKFIKKQNDFGKNYNGVIVIFERWNSNCIVQNLFSEMSLSKDGTTKFYFENYRYWIINVHKQKLPECEEMISVDPKLSDSQRILQLEELVKSMSSQIFYMQNRQEKSERELMENENKETYHRLLNMELRAQLQEKDWEMERNVKKYKQQIEALKEENEILRSISKYKDTENARLEEEVRDGTCVIAYVENQAQEMKQMLRAVLETDPIKPAINIYIKEYLD
jgi:hypothetical protein